MPPDGSAFENVIGDLSARFAGIRADRFDEVIEQTLRTVVEWFGTDRASFMEFATDLTVLVTTHAWARDARIETPPPRVIQRAMPWYFERLQRGRDVIFGSLPGGLPVEATAEREYASRVGMRAIMTLPLAIGGRIQCAISTGDFTRSREWMPIDVNRLRIIGEILANAFDRKRRDAELLANLDEIRALREQLEAENVSLREEIQAGHNVAEIVGRSQALRQVLARGSQVAPTGAAAAPAPLRRLDDVERHHIRGVLERCGWRVNGDGNAAEVLGLHPNTLRFRMKKLGISRPRLAAPARGRAHK